MIARAISFALALVVASLSPALAASPPTLEDVARAAGHIASPYPTYPGKTRCVCQTANDSSQTYFGYLNWYPVNNAGDETINVVCLYTVFTPGPGTAFCSLFTVIK